MLEVEGSGEVDERSEVDNEVVELGSGSTEVDPELSEAEDVAVLVVTLEVVELVVSTSIPVVEVVISQSPQVP